MKFWARMTTTRKVNTIEFSAVGVILLAVGISVVCGDHLPFDWPSWVWSMIFYAVVGVAIALAAWAADLSLPKSRAANKRR